LIAKKEYYRDRIRECEIEILALMKNGGARQKVGETARRREGRTNGCCRER